MSEPARRPRTPGIVYSALSLVVVVVVGVVALSSQQPPPPTIAEFAPQAMEQITDAPSEQSSQFGQGGEGECPPGAVDCLDAGGGIAQPTPPPSVRRTIDVPRVRRCIGDPPRQIEDPQSPPCVPYWEGDNGGATSKGVTPTEVRIAAPDCPEEGGFCTDLERFFNSRFEFYGRKLKIIPLRTEGGSAEAQRAAAEAADREKKVFASLDQSAGGGFHYYHELANRKIVSVSNQVNFAESDLSSKRPYMWQYPMAADEILTAIGTWACSRLHDRPARHAGSPTLQSRTRAFGIIFQRWNDDVPLTSEPLRRAFSRCGGEIAHQENFHVLTDARSATNAVIAMNARNVTSVFCLCNIVATGVMYRAATGQGYFPEWMTSTYLVQDWNFMIRTFANEPSQLANTFGITVLPRQTRLEDTPAWWAMREADPSRETASNPSAILATIQVQYRPLLLLASGIQMAGPNLTPETFERAMQRTQFPNPDHPIRAGKVGFTDGGHSMTIDAAEYWWSNTDRSPYTDEGRGTLCYVDGGTRRTAATWPEGDDSLFARPCDSGAIS